MKQKSAMTEQGNLIAFGVDGNDPKSREIATKIDLKLKEIFTPLNDTERTIALQLFSTRQVTSVLKEISERIPAFPVHLPQTLMDSIITVAKLVPKEIADRKKIKELLMVAEKEVFPLVEELAQAQHDANCPHCRGAAADDLANLWKGAHPATQGKPN